MDNRDRDKLSRNQSPSSSNVGKSKDESKMDFGKNIGKSEHITGEQSRRSNVTGESGMKGSSSSSRNLESDVTSDTSRGHGSKGEGYESE